MKLISYRLIIIYFLLFTSCNKAKKEDDFWPLGNYWKGLQTYGKVQAFRNGELWEASGIASVIESGSSCDISFGTTDPIDSVQREDLSFSNIPYQAGLFSVHHPAVVVNNPLWVDSLSSVYVLLYDDLLGTAFYPDTTKNNWIWVESVDSVQKIIKGKFDVSYRIEPAGASTTHYPNEVHFSNGVFEVKVH